MGRWEPRGIARWEPRGMARQKPRGMAPGLTHPGQTGTSSG
jgi:hypothetical protein